MDRNLPTGTVTLMFTDIEGSTRLQESYPDAMIEATHIHYDIARRVISESNGFVVKDQLEGDSVFAVFAEAASAAKAAVEFQLALAAEKWPEGVTIRSRCALHSGEVILRDGDYWGITVNRCARLRAIAHGGQILLSQATTELLQGKLPDSCHLIDMGAHRLKDLQRAERVFALVHPNIQRDFPPLRSIDLFANNLPIQNTSFIGREAELQTIVSSLRTNRIVTVTGPGGSGKSRLTLQAAAESLRHAEDGAWIIELRLVSDFEGIARAIASVLKFVERHGVPLLDSIIEELESRSLLLILDNCEHVRDLVALIVNTILQSCPNIRILASSREPLGANGELIYRIPTLTVPPPNVSDPLVLMRFDSVRLFADRASLAKPGFSINANNGQDVARVCRVVDGIPLALELTSARISGMPIDVLASRLEERLDYKLGPDKSLRNLVDWSYQLLSDEEKTVLCRVSVFAGVWDLSPADFVAGIGKIDKWDVGDHLVSLVNKSLVVFDDSQKPNCYRMLETIRRFAFEKLVESGEDVEIRTRHLVYFCDLASAQRVRIQQGELEDALEVLSQNHDNIRKALSFASQQEQLFTSGLTLAADLWTFCEVRGHFSEGREWIQDFLLLCPEPTAERANALNAFANLAWRQGMITEAEKAYTESLELREAASDDQGIAHSLNGLANICIQRSDIVSARPLIQRALLLNRKVNNRAAEIRNLMVLGGIEQRENQWEEALKCFDEAIEVCTATKDRQGLMYAVLNRGIVDIHLGNFLAAELQLRRAGSLCVELADLGVLADVVRSIAHVRFKANDAETSAQLHGAAAAIREDLGVRINSDDLQEFDDEIAHLRTALGVLRFIELHTLGRTSAPGLCSKSELWTDIRSQ